MEPYLNTYKPLLEYCACELSRYSACAFASHTSISKYTPQPQQNYQISWHSWCFSNCESLDTTLLISVISNPKKVLIRILTFSTFAGPKKFSNKLNLRHVLLAQLLETITGYATCCTNQEWGHTSMTKSMADQNSTQLPLMQPSLYVSFTQCRKG